MVIAIIALSIACFVMFSMLIQIRIGSKNTVDQIQRIKDQDTNNLVNIELGMGDSELINEINSLLKMLREERIMYNRKSHDIEQMMTNISHDLRTPLTSALGYVHLAQSDSIDAEEQKKELAITERRLRRLEELIDQFFEFYKVISGEKQPELGPVNLIGLLEEAVSHYFDDYNDRDRMIELNYDKSKILILSNKGMMMRVFDNLINNALKHGQGTLYINASYEYHEVKFTNATIDKQIDPEHIFDEFYTTDISRTTGSTGLGLAIAKQFVELLGGSISAMLNNDQFEITLKLPG